MISDLIKIYEFVANNAWKTIRWTSPKSSRVWSRFWHLMIMSGFRFGKDDLVNLQKRLAKNTARYGPYWHSPDEFHYSTAVLSGNISFAAAYEKLTGRIPFICKDIGYYECYYQTEIITGTQLKSSGRLIFNSKFTWQGEYVTVTNFKDEKHSLIACGYQKDKHGRDTSKIKKRFRISIDDFKKALKQTKNVT